MGFLKTSIEFLRLRGTSSLFDRAYTIQFELDGLRRPQPIPFDGLQVTKDISYHPQPLDNPALQSLDVYAPANRSTQRAYPVIVFLHGGGWRASDKDDPLGVHANVCKAIALRGFVAVNVNYRLAPRTKHPEPARDAAHALKWVIRNTHAFQGDDGAVFVSGHSAGGHLASLIALDSKYLRNLGLKADSIKGVIGICGVYDLAHFASRNWMAEHLMTRAAFGERSRARAEASPVTYVRRGAPPFLLLNAEEDERLEEESEELASRLREKGVMAETAVLPGTNHFTILSLVGNGDDTLIDRITNFVRDHSTSIPG